MSRHLVGSVAVVLLLGAAQVARAGCVGTRLSGLDPTGVSDNTAAIQAAIDTAYANGGGAVVLNPGRYLMNGTLAVKRGVTLCGATEGPFDVGPADPAVTTLAATFLITNTAAPFIIFDGFGAAVTDVLFHYPNQVLPIAAAPNVYPFTLRVPVWASATKIERCTVTNAYQFLLIEAGRTTARDLYIGAFKYGIYMDHVADRVTLSSIIQTVFWDIGAYNAYPQPIDTWVLNNGYGFVFLRADGVHVHDVLVFNRYAAFYVADSPDVSQFPRMGYGSATNIDIDTCRIGIIARSTHTPGFKFSNIDIGCGTPTDPAVSAVTYVAGGTFAPMVMLHGGSIRGVWAREPFPQFPPPAKLVVRHILGYDE